MEQDLNPQQYAAILRSIRLGRTLQIDHPNIAELYRQGDSQDGLVRKLNLEDNYGVTRFVAMTAIHYALKGHDKEFVGSDLSNYDGLMTAEEMEDLAKKHNSASARELHKQKKGMFGRDKQKHSQDSIHAGNITLEKRVGIHAQSNEEKKKAGLKGLKTQGNLPYSDEEIEYAYALTLNEEYQHSPESAFGRIIGKPNMSLIASELNQKYHNGKQIRTVRAVEAAISRYKLRNKIE